MSVQLIVFPQNFEGQYSSIASTANDFIVDGINFNTMNTSGTYDSSSTTNVILDSLTNAAPSIVNTWYRFRSTSSGTPTIPTELSGNLTLVSAPTLTLSGVYQKLSNLVVGTVYEIVLDLSTTGTGSVITSAYNGTTMITQPVHAANQSQITHTWTAQSTEDTIVISYYNTTTDFIAISNITVSEQGITPSIIYDLQDGQVICDLYEDEDIPLSLSVDDFKNVAEKVQSYSKAFNLPATKRNNQIFDNIFEITRTDTGLNFNPYKRTKAILKQNGFLLFEGYLRMLDISDKSGETSYNVNLYSEVVALADVLGDKTFSELDFTELEHDYQKTNILNSWNDAPSAGITYLNSSTSGFRDANSTVKYPFVDWTHQILVGGSGTGTAATDGNPELTNLETAFRPFINIKYLIDRIFEDVPFTYESEFFDTDDFKKLYMDFNWGSGNAPVVFNSSGELTNAADFSIGATFTTLPFDEMDYPLVGGTALNANFGYSAGVFTAQEDGQVYTFDYEMVFNQFLSVDTLSVEWLVNGVSVDFATTTSTQFSYSGNFTTPPLSAGDTVLCQAKSSLGFYELEGVFNPFGVTDPLVTITTSSNQTTSDTLLGTLRGELEQWNFLKGILTMFNLVTLPDEDNPSNIKIEPYSDVFLNNVSEPLDWTEKIDVSTMKLMPLTDLNKKTIFKFVEDEDDYAFNVYKSGTNHLYGSKKYNASEFTILSGEDEIIAEPFAATIIKPLMSQFPSFITPAIYARGDDDTWEGFENSPRIMFNNGIKSTGASFYIPAQNGGTSDNQANFLQFSHLTSVPSVTTARDFNFGECQLIPPAINPTNNNLFNLYWLPYYSELYNPDTRIMTIKVNLSPSDINTFKFNDTVFIKNRTFRVNKINYKPNDLATVEFILIP